MNANQPFGFFRRINRRNISILACFTLVATLGWLAFFRVPHDGPVAEIRPQTPSSPSEPGVSQPAVAVATPAPAATHAAVDPHEETPACSAGCSSHAHTVADPAAQAAPPSKRAWDYDFIESLATAAVGNPIRFELTDGVFAAGTIQHLEHVEGALIMVSGNLDAPEAGRFFFSDNEEYLTAFDGLTHGDNFGSTIRGYLMPSVSGTTRQVIPPTPDTYRFYISSDGSSSLLFSPNINGAPIGKS